ncbi:hypothetical protein MJH12_11630 [bacterium]|nr:hypothetical protein [bacterium]
MNKEFTMVNEGEIRFGPAYYSLILHGNTVPSRIFGHHYVVESNFLILEEWFNLEFKDDFITSLCVIDLEGLKYFNSKRVHSGFTTPISMDGKIVTFNRRYMRKSIVEKFDIDISNVVWKNI